MRPLSTTMEHALKLAGEGGGRLVRQSGGYWTTPQARLRSGSFHPWGVVGIDYTTTLTVQALISRGLFVVPEEEVGRPYYRAVNLAEEKRG